MNTPDLQQKAKVFLERGIEVITKANTKAILGKATARSADIAVRNLSSVPFGLGAFLGAKQYRQFPAWVGSSWDLDAGEGPYVIAPTIAARRQQITDMFTDELRRAFDEIGLEWE